MTAEALPAHPGVTDFSDCRDKGELAKRGQWRCMPSTASCGASDPASSRVGRRGARPSSDEWCLLGIPAQYGRRCSVGRWLRTTLTRIKELHQGFKTVPRGVHVAGTWRARARHRKTRARHKTRLPHEPRVSSVKVVSDKRPTLTGQDGHNTRRCQGTPNMLSADCDKDDAAALAHVHDKVDVDELDSKVS